MTKEQLLGEVEDLLRTMPSRVTMRQETGENVRWMGRLSAVISGWSTPHAIMLRGYLIQFNSHVAQLHDVGFRNVLTILYEAEHDLRMQTVGPISVAVSQGSVFHYFDEIRK